MEAQINLPLESKDIEKWIPHRYPFLLVDRVEALEKGQSLTAVKNISISDPILQGHFPEAPVYPGVLIIEALAQSSAILGYVSLTEGDKQVLLTEISQARFRKQILPGDRVVLKVKVSKSRKPFFWFIGEAFVNDSLVASATFSALMR